MTQPSDEQQIREVISTWMKATREGDADAFADLMTEDVTFLLPGHVMRGREMFVEGFRSMGGRMRIDGVEDIQEIQVSGDLAYCWNLLTVTVTPEDGSGATEKKGNILSVFKKEADGKWRLFRDANLHTSSAT